jgi:putative ABC transport system permease protein
MAAALASRRFFRTKRVALAWRNLVADKGRLVRASLGIGFAVSLMLVQLGFERGFFTASLASVETLDGDLFVINASKYRFGMRNPFAARELETMRSVSGVENVAPLYADWTDFFWTSPVDDKPHLVRVFAIDPNAPPVFTLSGIVKQQGLLTADDTVLIDDRSRAFLGMDGPVTEAKLNGLTVKVVGKFTLGPDFMSDGTVVMSAQTFAKYMQTPLASLPVETAVVRLKPGEDLVAAEQRLAGTLPLSLRVMTKEQVVAFERDFLAKLSSAAPIFWLGTLVGFVVGTLISYQIIYTELADRLPQYATLKGMGYGNGYLIGSVLRQALLTGIAGYIPAWLFCVAIYKIVGDIALLPLTMTVQLTLISLALTLGMCLAAGLIAVRRVVAADPAEVF